jgi:hypothetical protein
MVKTTGVFAMSRNNCIIPLIMGISIGLVFFGVQVALDAMNRMVRPENPYKLYSVCTDQNKWSFVILEKSFIIPPPQVNLPQLAGARMREVKMFVLNKYCSPRGEGSVLISGVLEGLNEGFNNAWQEFIRAAVDYYQRGYRFYKELCGRLVSLRDCGITG